MVQLVFPTLAHQADVLAFYRAFENAGQTCIGFANHNDYPRWLTGMQNRKSGTNLPDGYVRENFYLCYEDDRMVGVFSLKFSLTPYLLDFGGHVGYAVAPDQRCRGLATEILRQGLEIARQEHFARILAVCDDDNYASEKVILRNGGQLEDRRFDPDENVWVKRFWIAL